MAEWIVSLPRPAACPAAGENPRASVTNDAIKDFFPTPATLIVFWHI
jgi:hypothetical protein